MGYIIFYRYIYIYISLSVVVYRLGGDILLNQIMEALRE